MNTKVTKGSEVLISLHASEPKTSFLCHRPVEDVPPLAISGEGEASSQIFFPKIGKVAEDLLV